MTDSVSAYQSHDFIRTCIDLLCSGTAWRGGSFTSATPSLPQAISDGFDEDQLAEMARRMLLEGRALIRIDSNQGSSPVLEFPPSQGAPADTTTVEIERVESSFEPKGRPILERVLSSIELYEEALEQSRINPGALELVQYALPSIHSALAISPAMIDQARIAQTLPEFLMAGAIQFKSEVRMLRHNLRFGLDRVGEAIGQAMDLTDIEWNWNQEWQPSGTCKYGHVYQVFQAKGLVLEPIRASELGGIRLAANSGILSRATLAECEASYG